MNYSVKQRRAKHNMYLVSKGVITYVAKGDLIPFLNERVTYNQTGE